MSNCKKCKKLKEESWERAVLAASGLGSSAPRRWKRKPAGITNQPSKDIYMNSVSVKSMTPSIVDKMKSMYSKGRDYVIDDIEFFVKTCRLTKPVRVSLVLDMLEMKLKELRNGINKGVGSE